MHSVLLVQVIALWSLVPTGGVQDQCQAYHSTFDTVREARCVTYETAANWQRRQGLISPESPCFTMLGLKVGMSANA